MQTTTDPIEIAAKILTAYVARNPVPATSLPDLIRTVHSSITGLTTSPKLVLTKPTDAEIRKSISPDAIISFEDGKPYKALRRHLTMRGLSPEAYRAKWGLPVDYPFVSPSYSARRSLISRAIGQNQRLRFQQAAE
ncbi:MucR family transcriptional regulator [Methylobacterium sp. WL12]|uniref:MucR family transcriptional regulator n=1 Tax=Methylobacterium sp. WL12 TaxID=2603890 RepID=UPI0011C993DE|nr:MucR family transcriptional regulator [Methylobacterium sp. WL12]TXM65641.1 MucR family transcriptional regulator [Methylobacterium sp. WL12]